MADIDPEILARAEPLFHEVLGLPDEERPAFLDAKCAGDPSLRAALDLLLAHAEDDKGIFGRNEASNSHISPDSSLSAGQRIGRYQVVRPLGRGGMGQVLLARQEEPQREVALKVLRTDLAGESLIRRFKQEIEILGQLNHPGIAQIYEAGKTDDGLPYFAMEYAPGMPLGEFVRSQDLALKEKLELALQICDAVQHAHEHGILHRDLKPSNIMAFRLPDGSIQAKILDFGVARAIGLENQQATLHTHTGQLVGTLAYMSPEQISDPSHCLDERSDVYQLGVIFFELLTGQLPLNVGTSSFAEAVRRINEEDPVQLGVLDRKFKGDIETIVSTALSKEKNRRYASARDLGDDIRRYQAGAPITARPATAFYHLAKFSRKYRWAAAGVAVMAAVLALMIIFRPEPTTFPVPVALKMTRLTADSENGTFKGSSPVLSPDGRILAYALSGDVVFRDMVTGETAIALPAIEEKRYAYGLSWFPDGKELLLEFFEVDKGWCLIRWDIASGKEELVNEGETYGRNLVSPDGQFLLLSYESGQKFCVKDLDTGAEIAVWSPAPGESISQPIWAPDSRHLAYVRSKEPNYHLEYRDFHGNVTVLLSDIFLQPLPTQPGMSWLPDGRLVYCRFSDYSAVGTEIWAIEIDLEASRATGPAKMIHSLEDRQPTELTYCPETRSLVFKAHLRRREMVKLNLLDNPPLKPVVLPTRGWATQIIGWTPDGKSVLLEEANSTRPAEPLLMDWASGEFHEFDCVPDEFGVIGLSPSGSHVYVRSDSTLWVAAMDCSEFVDLGFKFTTPPRWSAVISSRGPDAVSYLQVKEGTVLHLWPVSPENGVGPEAYTIELDAEGIYGQHNAWANISPDGSQLAITEFKPEIKLYDLATGGIRLVPVEFGTVQALYWSWTGKWIYCMGTRKTPFPRWMGRLDPKTGVGELLWTSRTGMMNEPFESPDGTSLIVTTMEMGNDLFILEGL